MIFDWCAQDDHVPSRRNLVKFPYCSWYTPRIAIWEHQAFDDMQAPEPGSFTQVS